MKILNIPQKFARKTRTPEHSPQNSAKTSAFPYNPCDFLEKYHELLKSKSKLQKQEISSLKTALFSQEKPSFSAKPSRFDELLTISSKKSGSLLQKIAEMRQELDHFRREHALFRGFFAENREFLREKLANFLKNRENAHELEKLIFQEKLAEESNSKVQQVQEKYENREKEQKDKLLRENARKDEIIKQYQRLFEENGEKPQKCTGFEALNPRKTRKNASFHEDLAENSQKYATFSSLRQEIAQLRRVYQEKLENMQQKLEELLEFSAKTAEIRDTTAEIREKPAKTAEKLNNFSNFEVFEKIQDKFKKKDAERRCAEFEAKLGEFSQENARLCSENERLLQELSAKTAVYNEVFKENLRMKAEKRILQEKLRLCNENLREKDSELQIKSAIFARKAMNTGDLSRKFKQNLSPLDINYELIKKI